MTVIRWLQRLFYKLIGVPGLRQRLDILEHLMLPEDAPDAYVDRKWMELKLAIIDDKINKIAKAAKVSVEPLKPREAPTVTGWHVWMEDEKEFDSLSSRPSDIPPIGVQAVMVRRSDDTRVFLRGAKWYVWQKDTVVATVEELPKIDLRGDAQVKEGTKISDERFKLLMERTKVEEETD